MGPNCWFVEPSRLLTLFIVTLVVLGGVKSTAAAELSASGESQTPNSFTVQIRAMPTVEDQYCVTRMSPPEWALGRTVIGFEPLPGSAAHHIILFTCRNTPAPEADFRQDQCSTSEGEEHVCGDIQFVWAHGGSPFWLPPNVGLKLGKTKSELTFALQVHFGRVTTWQDFSGVRLILADESDEQRSSWNAPRVLLLAPWRFTPLQPGRELLLVATGQVEQVSRPMSVFAVRTHAHDRGLWNEVWVTRNGKRVWHYKRSVQLPQSFIPLPAHVKLLPGDRIEFQCAYNTMRESKVTYEGATKHDEMCNVYLMYYTPSKDSESSSGKVSRLRPVDQCALEYLSSAPFDVQMVGVSADVRTMRVYGFHRGNAIWNSASFDGNQRYLPGPTSTDVLMEIDAISGDLLRSMGKDQFYLPHSVKVDPHKPGRVWLVDVGSHLVSEYDLNERKIVRSIGTKLQPGSGPDSLCMPTDIAFSANESLIYVSDGYCNSRVVVYRRSDLKFVKQFGSQGPAQNQFDLPHSVNTFTCSNELLIVSDRENGRVQILDAASGAVRKLFNNWDRKYLPYSAVADPSTGRLFVGLTHRDGRERRGAIWVSHHGICDAIANSDVTASHGALICDKDEDNTREPHMLSVLGRRLFVAEAVDGQFAGRLVAIPF